MTAQLLCKGIQTAVAGASVTLLLKKTVAPLWERAMIDATGKN
jgi:hypothetical protein